MLLWYYKKNKRGVIYEDIDKGKICPANDA